MTSVYSPTVQTLSSYAYDLCNKDSRFESKVVSRLFLVVCTPLATISEVFLNVCEMGLKVPMTVSYVLVGWIPLGKNEETGKWEFLGTNFEDRYKFHAHLKNIKQIAFCFYTVVVLTAYGIYDPKESSKLFLDFTEQNLALSVTKPPKTSSSPSSSPSSSTSSSSTKIDRPALKTFSDRSSYPATGTSSKFQQLIVEKQKDLNHVETNAHRTCIDKASRILDKDQLTEDEKENIKKLKSRLSVYPGKQSEALLKIYYDNNKLNYWNISLSKEIIGSLYWKAIAREKKFAEEFNDDEEESLTPETKNEPSVWKKPEKPAIYKRLSLKTIAPEYEAGDPQAKLKKIITPECELSIPKIDERITILDNELLKKSREREIQLADLESDEDKLSWV